MQSQPNCSDVQRLQPFVPSEDLQRRLEEFVACLSHWNRRLNLTADASPSTVNARHIVDSLQLVQLLPSGDEAVADIGSGAGLPGLVIAMATDLTIHLIEADRRKAAFLIDTAGRLKLRNVVVHADRVENVQFSLLSAVTARAFAPLRRILPYASRMLGREGVAILPKGRSAEADLADAQRGWTMSVERFASNSDPTSIIFRLKDIRPKHPHA